MKENKRIIIAHPGCQHSFRVAKALEENGYLYKYVTTVYFKDSSFLMHCLNFFLSKDNQNRLSKRKCQYIDDSKVILFNEIGGLLVLLVLRLDKTRRLYKWLNEYISRSFQKKTAKYAIKHNVDAIICYDTNAMVCFNILAQKAPYIIRIMDNASPARNFLYKIYSEKKDLFGEFIKTYKSFNYLTDRKNAEYFGQEIASADFHIAASTFSRKSLIYNNVPEKNILLVPYGVDSSLFNFSPQSCNFENDTLKILYVGVVDQRKGISQILNAAKHFSGKDIEFNIVGGRANNFSELYEPYKPYATFWGTVPFSTIKKFYQDNHIFVFPTMGDGFGLVLLEALSSGLPVITTYNCAGPDLIQDGENGFLIEAGDTDMLIEKICWFKNNPQRLREMSQNARETAQLYTWEIYEKKLINGINYCMAIKS